MKKALLVFGFIAFAAILPATSFASDWSNKTTITRIDSFFSYNNYILANPGFNCGEFASEWRLDFVTEFTHPWFIGNGEKRDLLRQAFEQGHRVEFRCENNRLTDFKVYKQ